MKKENIFYLILILTIIVARLLILIFPEVDIKFFDIVVHHFWLGIVLMIFGWLVSNENVKLYFLGIGFGLVIDQIVFIILGAGKDQEYWALPSLLGMVILVVAIYFVRAKIARLILK